MVRARWISWFAALTLVAGRLHAQASTAGTPVAATHLAAESNPTVIADGTGGAYVGFKIAWRSPSVPAEVAVARLLPSAGRHPEWTALPPPPAGSMLVDQYAPTRILPAPALQSLAFADIATTSQPDAIFLRQMDGDGIDPSFGEVSSHYSFTIFTVLPRSDGGASVFSKVPGSVNVLETIVGPTGSTSENPHPVAINNRGFWSVAGEKLVAVPSGGDGAIVVEQVPIYDGFTQTNGDLIAMRLDAASNVVWDPDHSIVSIAVKDQIDPVGVSDDADGIIVAWQDNRSVGVGPDIYGVRLTSAGGLAAGWTSQGKVICNAARAQYSPAIERDGTGGAWIAWTDDRDTLSGPDIYFTHILANGSIAPGFPANGAGLCTAIGSQTEVRLARDGSGGCFAVWLDSRDGEVDLYGEHFGATGAPTSGWVPGGNPVCTDGTAQGQPSVAWVSNGRAITAWKDARTGTDVVYAAALDATRGVLDVPRASPGRLALSAGANPARGVLELRVDAAETGDVKVLLYDVGGRALAERMVAGPASAASVRFEGLRPGLYFASAASGGAQASAKVVVVR